MAALVHHILADARRRLAVLSREAMVCDAAALLVNPSTPLVVVCDGAGVAVGVISRSDIVKVLALAKADCLLASAGTIMTTTMLSCHVDETLHRVWELMSGRSLRCAPVLDEDGRPQGIVHARDLALALLDEVTQEEALLRDYVLGIGYQ